MCYVQCVLLRVPFVLGHCILLLVVYVLWLEIRLVDITLGLIESSLFAYNFYSIHALFITVYVLHKYMVVGVL